MILKCQEDSFLKEFKTHVISCEPATLQWSPTSSAARELTGYDVMCENTILYPEGGGQPCDYGTMNGQPVRQVRRQNTNAIHFVEMTDKLETGQEVILRVDWQRRLDHMQQHSGQHLITDLVESEFGYETTSWWLGSEVSYIELNTAHLLSRESLDLIENKANDLIRYGKQVKVALMDPIECELKGIHGLRGLPKNNVNGPIRVIQIDGHKDNMCCGTHVSDLCQLQAIKLLYAEKNSKGCFVYFLVGQRLLQRLAENHKREQQFTSILKGGAKQHVELLQKMQTNLKTIAKSFQRLLKEIATSEAVNLTAKHNVSPQPYFSLHRRDGLEVDFIHTFLRNAPDNIPLYFLTVWDVNNTPVRGHMVLRGSPELVANFGHKFLELLNGKGGSSNEKSFQGKITNPNNIGKCEDLLKEYFHKPIFINTM